MKLTDTVVLNSEADILWNACVQHHFTSFVLFSQKSLNDLVQVGLLSMCEVHL